MAKNILQIGMNFLRTGKFSVGARTTKTLLQAGMDAASSGNLPIGAKMTKILDSGTVVDVVNKGKGVLQKVVKKQNGDEFTSIFKDGKLQQMTARNSRGEYIIKPVFDDTWLHEVRNPCLNKHDITGIVYEPTHLTFSTLKDIDGPKAGRFSWLFDLNDVNNCYNRAGAKKLYDYLVKQNPNETLKDLYKYKI